MKEINKAYKFRFYPDKELKTLLAKTFGCVRLVYNKTLDYSQEHYKNKEFNPDYKPLSNTDRINYVKILKNKPEFSFLKEPSSITLQQSVRNLNTAYSRFFTKKAGFPTYKKKLNRNSFTITGKDSIIFRSKQSTINNDLNIVENTNIQPSKNKIVNHNKNTIKNKHKLNHRHLTPSTKNKNLSINSFNYYLPKYEKPLNIKFTRDFNHLAVSSVFVSQEPSGDYFITFAVKENITTKPVVNSNLNSEQKTSFDLGIKTTATIYNGIEFKEINIPDLIKNINDKIKVSQRLLSRKTKGSKNRNKQRIKLNKLHQKRNNILTDFYQKQSSILINENQVVIREDLDINQMKQNKLYSNSIQNVAWKRFVSMIEYKAKWHDREIIAVNQYYPSSKLCSGCHTVYKALSIKERTWTCQSCGMNHNRDQNACINLFNYNNSVGTTDYACGDLKFNYLNNKLAKQESSAL